MNAKRREPKEIPFEFVRDEDVEEMSASLKKSTIADYRNPTSAL